MADRPRRPGRPRAKGRDRRGRRRRPRACSRPTSRSSSTRPGSTTGTRSRRTPGGRSPASSARPGWPGAGRLRRDRHAGGCSAEEATMSHDFTDLPDLAVARARRRRRLRQRRPVRRPGEPRDPGAARPRPGAFGPRGKVYDGWETRRRRTPGNDLAIVRLGVRGVVSGVVVDTAYFVGNYPPQGERRRRRPGRLPVGGRAARRRWPPLVPVSAVEGDTRQRVRGRRRRRAARTCG